MIKRHEVTIDQRPATCCDRHTSTWVSCSCGWEENVGLLGSTSDVNIVIIGHRLLVVEDLLNKQL